MRRSKNCRTGKLCRPLRCVVSPFTVILSSSVLHGFVRQFRMLATFRVRHAVGTVIDGLFHFIILFFLLITMLSKLEASLACMQTCSSAE